ncbi:hypothetical protein HZ326_27356 [Fusarium oxysporum f. sp. albedinis]|nr:hypothetical protein HZ326_27356 [Fusarium oxysporum f. sp. albedinis]
MVMLMLFISLDAQSDLFNPLNLSPPHFRILLRHARTDSSHSTSALTICQDTTTSSVSLDAVWPTFPCQSPSGSRRCWRGNAALVIFSQKIPTSPGTIHGQCYLAFAWLVLFHPII